MQFSTKAIHVGQKPDPFTGSLVPPIYMTATYAQEAPDVHKGYDYTRAFNPNFTELEHALASLEEAEYSTVFSSGMAGITALAATLTAGDSVIASNDVYGGTYRLFETVFKNLGVHFSQIDTQNLEEVAKALSKKPQMIILETPSNPLLKISDISAITSIAKKYKVLSVVDNTFATPYFLQPLKLGADIVLHSTSKYISGHGDLIGGALVTNSKKTKGKMDYMRMTLGLNPSPFDTWLTVRGLQTLAVRMQKHEENAISIVKFLTQHPLTKRIYFPGLESHQNHQVAKREMKGYGGMISVEFDLSVEETKKLISSFSIFTLAEHLGTVHSLVCHPATMTHASIPRGERIKRGLSDSLVRFSIGIEDPEDLINDLKTSLSKMED